MVTPIARFKNWLRALNHFARIILAAPDEDQISMPSSIGTDCYGTRMERHGSYELWLKVVDGIDFWRLTGDNGLVETWPGTHPAIAEIDVLIRALEVGVDQAVEEFG